MDQVIVGTTCIRTGESHHNAKYSNEQIDLVQQILYQSINQIDKEIASETQTSERTVKNIRLTGKRSGLGKKKSATKRLSKTKIIS